MRGLLTIVFGLSMTGCDKAPTPTDAATGCSKDSDCKGERVCDKGQCVEPKTDPTQPAPAKPDAPAPSPDAPTADVPPAVPAAVHAAGEPPPADAVDCDALVAHIYTLLAGTEGLRAQSEEVARCRTRANDPKVAACFMAASDKAAMDACNVAAFGGQVDATVVRSFKALDDNTAADPPLFSADGDYVAWSDDCGLLMREIPPAGGLFVTCNGQVKIGPIVNQEDLDKVMAQISDESKSQHDLVMGIIDNYPSGRLGVRVHKYDSDGRFVGTEER